MRVAQRVAASELDVGTVGELTAVIDLGADKRNIRHHPSARRRSSAPGTSGHASSLRAVVAPRRAEKIWKSSSWTSSRLRRARDAGRSWHCAGRASLSLSGRMRMHDHAQRLAPRSLQLLWFSGRARPLPQTMDVLGSRQSSETSRPRSRLPPSPPGGPPPSPLSPSVLVVILVVVALLVIVPVVLDPSVVGSRTRRRTTHETAAVSPAKPKPPDQL